jgi:hypothetical protein
VLNDPEVARLYLGANAGGTMGAAVAASHPGAILAVQS